MSSRIMGDPQGEDSFPRQAPQGGTYCPEAPRPVWLGLGWQTVETCVACMAGVLASVALISCSGQAHRPGFARMPGQSTRSQA